MSKEKSLLIVVLLLSQICVVALLVVSFSMAHWAQQQSSVLSGDVREVDVGIFQFCDSLRRGNGFIQNSATKCVRCFNTASKSTYNYYKSSDIKQSFYPDSDHNERTGAFFQTLAISTLVVSAAFFFLFLFYSQLSLLLKIYPRLQNYLLLGSFLSGILQLAGSIALVVMFRKHYRNVKMGTGQTLIFTAISVASLQLFIIIRVGHLIVKEYNAQLLRTSGLNSRRTNRNFNQTKHSALHEL